MTPASYADLPAEQPLAMPDQSFGQRFVDPAAPVLRQPRLVWRRIGAFGAAFALTAAFTAEMAAILSANGMTGLEYAMTVLFALSFIWIALGLVNAVIGAAVCLRRSRESMASVDAPGLKVALLMPTYNEAPARVMANAAAMLSALSANRSPHVYDLFVLSDTTNDVVAAEEREAVRRARASLTTGGRVFYRRRARNIGRKAGNLREWCSRFGAGYDAMLTLDADSLMSAGAIRALTDTLSADPGVGLVQSVPRLINTPTLFGRLQRFATAAYGPVLAEGLAYWAGDDGNYWGHNAIIRTRAFATCAGLPDLIGPRPIGGAIMSHDFVEAALLRRAGWRVRILTTVRDSYEEPPPSLVDAAIRDRRWSQGNLQHMGVIGARGLAWVSRFHLLQGIMAYVSAPVWMAFMIVGAFAHAAMQREAEPVYLTTNWFLYDPFLSPSDPERASTLMILTLLVLVIPKVIGVAAQARLRPAPWRWGGRGRLLGSTLLEILISAVTAPILMTQQSLAVVRNLAGVDHGWSPQAREAQHIAWPQLLRFHWLEMTLGAATAFGIVFGGLSLWLAPVALSLALAAPISRMTSIGVDRFVSRTGLLATPEDAREPNIVRRQAQFAPIFAATGKAAEIV